MTSLFRKGYLVLCKLRCGRKLYSTVVCCTVVHYLNIFLSRLLLLVYVQIFFLNASLEHTRGARSRSECCSFGEVYPLKLAQQRIVMDV